MTKVNIDMRESMCRLREEGKTVREIAERMGLSKSTISYHTNPLYRDRTRRRCKANNRRKTGDV